VSSYVLQPYPLDIRLELLANARPYSTYLSPADNGTRRHPKAIGNGLQAHLPDAAPRPSSNALCATNMRACASFNVHAQLVSPCLRNFRLGCHPGIVSHQRQDREKIIVRDPSGLTAYEHLILLNSTFDKGEAGGYELA